MCLRVISLLKIILITLFLLIHAPQSFAQSNALKASVNETNELFKSIKIDSKEIFYADRDGSIFLRTKMTLSKTKATYRFNLHDIELIELYYDGKQIIFSCREKSNCVNYQFFSDDFNNVTEVTNRASIAIINRPSGIKMLQKIKQLKRALE